MKKLLVLYGHHEAEKKFGKDICEALTERLDDQDILEIRNIKNNSTEESAYNEMGDIVNEIRPYILLDLHHSRLIPLEEPPPFIPEVELFLFYQPFARAFSEYLKRLSNNEIYFDPWYYSDRQDSKPNLKKQLWGPLGVFLDIANKNETRFLVAETYLCGCNNVIFESEYNKATFEKLVDFIGGLYDYIKRI
jgi:hypothetical protein